MYASYGTSWRARGDHSPRATPRQPFALFLYSRASLMSSSIWLALFVVLSRWRLYWNVFSSLCSLSLSLSLSLCCFCVSSLTALSALVSADALLSSLRLVSSPLCSRLVSDSASVSSLPRLRLSLVACDFYTGYQHFMEEYGKFVPSQKKGV